MSKYHWSRCPHTNLRGIYGDEINRTPKGRRLRCEDCGRLLDGPVSLSESEPTNAEHRKEWANYIDSWDQTVGVPMCTPRTIAAALRWEHVPFGKGEGI